MDLLCTIHVDQVKYDQTKGLAAIMKHLTLDPSASRFHLVPAKLFQVYKSLDLVENVLVSTIYPLFLFVK